jgi:hypothetical protein
MLRKGFSAEHKMVPPSPMMALTTSSSPESQRSLDSYQVLNADGMDTRQIRLPRNKRSFSRAPWIVRKLHSNKVVSSLHDHAEALEKSVEEAIEELKKRKHPSYRDVLHPLFSIFPVMANIMSSSEVAAPSGGLSASFSDLLSLIVTKSAAFFNHSRTQPEARLLTPRGHYRALTNYWAYLIVGYCLDQNNDDDEDRYKMVYAYSFIYPYMDDLLDKQNSSESFQSGKKKLIANITHQIESGKIPDTMAFAECGDQDALETERRVYELLDQLLSSQSSSSSKSATPLQESLLAINMAQRASLQQHVDWTDLRAGVMVMPKSQKQLIWEISIHKGVSSIIPNAYFYAPAGITKEQAEMVAVIGYMGQFLNDIEGLHEDEAEKSLTPALISFLKHGTLDRFIERCWAHLQILLRRIGNRFPTLSRDRLEVLLRLMTVRLLATAAMMHQEFGGVLSDEFVDGVEQSLGGVPISVLANLACVEQVVFGGTGEAHQLETPEQFRSFVLTKTEEWRASVKMEGGLRSVRRGSEVQ